MMDIFWLVALLVMNGACYLLGKADGEREAAALPLSDEAQLELEKYKYEAFYAHERWKEKTRNRYSACMACSFLDIEVDAEPCNTCRRNPAGAQDGAGTDHFNLIDK